jgi:hypothetical protein
MCNEDVTLFGFSRIVPPYYYTFGARALAYGVQRSGKLYPSASLWPTFVGTSLDTLIASAKFSIDS